MWAFANGGNAVDAAIAANGATAVVAPHLCGLGGDLFALVMAPDGTVHALNASGRAGSGADAAAMRDEGLAAIPLRHDVRAVTVPGCVDGWLALHERFGSLALADVLRPAIALAAGGFPASPLLVGSVAALDEPGRQQLHELAVQATTAGTPVRRPAMALVLQGIASGGRGSFYGGAFGEGLVEVGGGWFSEDDLAAGQADWVEPLCASVFGVELHTMPPNSQGYLTLAIAQLAEQVGLPESPDDERWARVLVEAAIAASHDRPAVLHEGADGPALLTTAASRVEEVGAPTVSRRPVSADDGDTTYLCTADASGLAVSLIQSNASGFGSFLAEPTTGINLHNRGLGFSLQAGHPAELAPGRRPPHTLSPAIAGRDGRLAAVLGTMGGDAQPQIVAQLAARLFAAGVSPADAVAAPRWVLRGPSTGFDTWTSSGPPTVLVEDGAPASWVPGLAGRGHHVARGAAFDGSFGHAHVIVAEPAGFGVAADPRSVVGAAAAV